MDRRGRSTRCALAPRAAVSKDRRDQASIEYGPAKPALITSSFGSAAAWWRWGGWTKDHAGSLNVRSLRDERGVRGRAGVTRRWKQRSSAPVPVPEARLRCAVMAEVTGRVGARQHCTKSPVCSDAWLTRGWRRLSRQPTDGPDVRPLLPGLEGR